MLYTSAVEPKTLSLLKRLMQMPELKEFCLVGGTALALKYGHRKSIDLDLFNTEKFDKAAIILALEKEFLKEFVYEPTKITFAIFCKINQIKVDLVHYPHPIISEVECSESIKMYGNQDIAAMKINAILGRGVKKDFFDLAELLKNYNLTQILNWHKQKYPNQMLAISIPVALTYFDDANDSDDAISLNGTTWENVKKTLQQKVREFLS